MKVLISISLLIILTSCSSTIDFHVPTQNFQPPEVVGGPIGIRAQATYTNTSKFSLASLEQKNIFSSQINVSTEGGITKDNTLNLMAGLGALNLIEIMYRVYSDSPGIVAAKVQLWGRDNGKREKGLKASIFAGHGKDEVDRSTLRASNLAGNTRSYSAVLDVSTFEIGSSIGHRFNEQALVYLAANYRSSEAEARLTSDDYEDLDLRNNAIIRSLQLGLQVNSADAYLLLEGGYARSIWKGVADRDDYSLGFSIGLTQH